MIHPAASRLRHASAAPARIASTAAAVQARQPPGHWPAIAIPAAKAQAIQSAGSFMAAAAGAPGLPCEMSGEKGRRVGRSLLQIPSESASADRARAEEAR